MKLAICICTYRRPAGLVKLLRALEALANNISFKIFVVDNHAAAEGLTAVTALQEMGYCVPIHAARSHHDGISQARNQVLQLAIDSRCDFAALIDDDEWPSSVWLTELLRVQAIDDAAAVGGPTEAVFAEEPAENLKHSIYYGANLGLHNNAKCTLQACGNVLLKIEALKQLDQPFFDPELGLSGGEDLQFFMRLGLAGYHMRWAKDAVVYETVPPERSTVVWLKNRVALIANTRVHIMKKIEPNLSAALVRLSKTTALAAQSAVLSLLGLFHPKIQFQAMLHRAKFHGKLQAHLGRRLAREENH